MNKHNFYQRCEGYMREGWIRKLYDEEKMIAVFYQGNKTIKIGVNQNEHRKRTD